METVKFVSKLLEKQSSDLLKPVRGLARKHIFPTSIEKQTVKPAMDVFRSDVTAAIRLHAELKVLKMSIQHLSSWRICNGGLQYTTYRAPKSTS